MANVVPHILVVDDDNRNQKIMQEILEDDFSLSFACSGESCLENVSTLDPDLILLDIMMPGMDGYDVCRQLKAQQGTRDVPVIFVSGKDLLEDRIKAFEVGADNYFVKPFDHDDLLGNIKKTLDNVSERAQLANRAEEASAMAFSAMTENSRLGSILRFMEASFTVQDYSSLVKQIFEATSELGISCSMQIRSGEETLSFIDHGVINPLEVSLLTKTQHKGRFFDFHQRSIVNYEHISLLIKNMPVDDEVLYGSIKDNICYLLNGADSCLKGLHIQIALRQHKQHLLDTIAASTEVMEKLRDSYHEMSMEAATIVEDTNDEIKKAILFLALREDQEKTIDDIAEHGLQRTIALFGRGIDGKFAKLTEKFSRLMLNS